MIKDWRGNEIKVGSKILWPGRGGSRLWVTEGEVVEIRMKKRHSWDSDSDLVPVLKVRTFGSTSGLYHPDKPDPTLSTIHVIDRVTVIPEESAICIPSVFGEVGKEPTVSGWSISYEEGAPKIDPFEMPEENELKVFHMDDIEPEPEHSFSCSDPFEIAKETIDMITPDQRRQLTRMLIQKSVNLGLKDVKDV